MRKIRDISEDEMIAVFLQTELNSTRFRQDIEAYLQQERIDPQLLHIPDWRNAQENALRRAILGVHRGYGRNEGYFIGFPADVRWERVTLTREELEQVRYIDYDYWVELSGGTRLAIDGAKNALVRYASRQGEEDRVNSFLAGASAPDATDHEHGRVHSSETRKRP